MRRKLETHLEISGVYAWSHSTVVLSWLLNPKVSLKDIVSNHIHHIRTLLTDFHWSYVKSEDDIADCIRLGLGLTPLNMVNNKLF